jgi:hypothetical protein
MLFQAEALSNPTMGWYSVSSTRISTDNHYQMALVICVLAREKTKDRGSAMIGVSPSFAGDRGREEDLYFDESFKERALPPSLTVAAQLRAAVKSSCGGKSACTQPQSIQVGALVNPCHFSGPISSRDPILSSLSPRTIIFM